MQIKDVTNYIEQLAPLSYAEDFDNVGLLIGNYNTEVTGVLVTLDTLEETVDEAIANNCNLIVSFHPIVFSGLKKINGNNYVERVVLKAIQHNIAIYATHTALDNVNNGVSAKMGEVLGLENMKTLIPKKGIIKKLTTYVPFEEATNLREKLFEAGAGNIGNYDNCSFNVEGKGKKEFEKYMDNVLIGIPNLYHGVEIMVFENELLATRAVYNGTHKGELFGFEATNNRIKYNGASFFRFNNDKIADVWVLGDLVTLHKQLVHK